MIIIKGKIPKPSTKTGGSAEEMIYELRLIRVLLCKQSFNEDEIKNQNWRKLADRLNWTGFLISMIILITVILIVITQIKY